MNYSIFYHLLLFTVKAEADPEADTEDDDKVENEKDKSSLLLYECCRGKQGFVGVGDIVQYLGQLVCVILSILRHPLVKCMPHVEVWIPLKWNWIVRAQ